MAGFMGLYLYENGLVTDEDEVTEDEIQKA